MLRLMTTSSLLVCLASATYAAEPESCATVRLAEPGWNDLALTTGAASVVLQALGYEVKSDLLGIEVIYQSLKENELDVFLGYWDPAMQTYAAPYEAEGSVERVGVNLPDAKYTFAVPSYVAKAGVRDFKDLAKFADEFGKELHGIEPGSNQLMFDVIADPAFALDLSNTPFSVDYTILEDTKLSNEIILSEALTPSPQLILSVCSAWPLPGQANGCCCSSENQNCECNFREVCRFLPLKKFEHNAWRKSLDIPS